MAATKGRKSAAVEARAPMLVKQDSRREELGAVRLYPQRARFITGVAREYDDTFPPELGHLVRAVHCNYRCAYGVGIDYDGRCRQLKEEDFEAAINQINNTLKDYWPCFFCVCCGYACCPCTLGASLLCPNFYIRDVNPTRGRSTPVWKRERYVLTYLVSTCNRLRSTCSLSYRALTSARASRARASSGGSCAPAAAPGCAAAPLDRRLASYLSWDVIDASLVWVTTCLVAGRDLVPAARQHHSCRCKLRDMS